MNLENLTKIIILNFKNKIFRKNNVYWKRIKTLDIENFEIELDLSESKITNVDGLYKLNIIFLKIILIYIMI